MPTQYLEYELQGGYIDNWLIAGPVSIDVDLSSDPSLPDIPTPPCEWDPPVTIGGKEVHWQYQSCTPDHWLDLSFNADTRQRVYTWAYIELLCPVQVEIELRYKIYSPFKLWLSSQQVMRLDRLDVVPHTGKSRVMLQQGNNQLLIQMEQENHGLCPFMLALHVSAPEPLQEKIRVVIPTTINNPKRRKHLEQVIQGAYLDRDLYLADDSITAFWPDDIPEITSIALQVRDPEDNVYCEARHEAQAGSNFGLIKGLQNSSGHYRVAVFPVLKEYYEETQRIIKYIDIHVLNEPYAPWTTSSLNQRRSELLERVALRGKGLYAEMAKMALNRWSRVKINVILDVIAGIDHNLADSESALIGLLTMVKTYGDNPEFPPRILTELDEVITMYLEGAFDTRNPGNKDIQTLSVRILAREMLPDSRVSELKNAASSLQDTTERDALSWMKRSASKGFSHWGSDYKMAEELIALIPLAQWAHNPAVKRLATALANKILFSLAINSYLGILSSPQESANSDTLKHPLLGPSAGLSHYLWGMGVHNREYASAITLATASSFVPSEVITRIAHNMPQEMWNLERHAGMQPAVQGSDDHSWEVHKAAYRTPDYMLSAALDWHPGERGTAEHIWQATLGPDAVVFTNHPGCLSENPGFRPNFWCGNACLPRVAQWKDVVVALYHLPADDPLGFTHAYFPIYAFDEYKIEGSWAFARKGEAYLALGSSQGLELVSLGLGACRELRSRGRYVAWLCQMGRSELDGDFDEFRRKVLALKVQLDSMNVQYQTLRGDHLRFGWQERFMVNGTEVSLRHSKHYDNRYCVAEWPAQRMILTLGRQKTELDFNPDQA
jgi:hypothetical protein